MKNHENHQHHDMQNNKHNHSHEIHDHQKTEHGMNNHEHHGGSHDEHKGHASHHEHMIADFRKRFWISLAVTVPILLLSPLVQQFIGLGDSIRFPGDSYLAFIFSSFVFFYGGFPFLKGMFDELRKKQPGMMTLIAVAVSVAYFYSSAVVFGLEGKVFFWELAT